MWLLTFYFIAKFLSKQNHPAPPSCWVALAMALLWVTWCHTQLNSDLLLRTSRVMNKSSRKYTVCLCSCHARYVCTYILVLHFFTHTSTASCLITFIQLQYCIGLKLTHCLSAPFLLFQSLFKYKWSALIKQLSLERWVSISHTRESLATTATESGAHMWGDWRDVWAILGDVCLHVITKAESL